MKKIKYIGKERALLLSYEEKKLLCTIINRSNAKVPMAQPSELHHYGAEFVLTCIREKMPELTEKAKAMAESAMLKLI